MTEPLSLSELAARTGRRSPWPPELTRSPADRNALLVLASLPTMPPRDVHALAWRVRTAGRCVEAIAAGEAGTDTDRAVARAVDVAGVRAAVEACGARIVAPDDDEYLPSLLDLHDPPPVLFVRGRSLAELPPAVAIVGARHCSPYGREVASSIAGGVAAAKVRVVSGAARGVDAAAHLGTLRAGGGTAAVLGCGIDVAYPRRHARLLERLAADGWVLSEYPPGTRAAPRRFPARNRLIAALTLGTLVVEGALGSGSLHTARFAADIDRVVLAVPGPITSPLARAPHALIREYGTLVESHVDVLTALKIRLADDGEDDATAALPDLSDAERRVVRSLRGAAMTAEQVAIGAGLAIGATLAALASLEVRGVVTSAGGRYERTARATRPKRGSQK